MKILQAEVDQAMDNFDMLCEIYKDKWFLFELIDGTRCMIYRAYHDGLITEREKDVMLFVYCKKKVR